MNTYIFDFGQVLVHFEPAHMTGVYVPDPAQRAQVEAVVFDRRYWDRLDRGDISDEQVKRAFCRRLPAALRPAARRVYDNWYRNLEPVAGMSSLLQELKDGGASLYLLSNISRGFAEGYAQVPSLVELLAPFDGKLFSGLLGLVKPDRAIFRKLLEQYGLDPGDCLFIDDNPDNIRGAGEAGIRGYLFDGDVDRLRRILLSDGVSGTA